MRSIVAQAQVIQAPPVTEIGSVLVEAARVRSSLS
jgi:hypothetical protein